MSRPAFAPRPPLLPPLGTWPVAAAAVCGEAQAPRRVRGRWSFQVEEGRRTGMLVELPSEAVLREVSATR
ncbi:MAG: hypothetical protein R2862_08735 [Thermoanaerobaculia bacterium]